MSEQLVSFGWAACFPHWSNSAGQAHENSVRSTRKEAICVIGEAWANIGETPEQGWQRAYRHGWRARRVEIRVLAFGADQ